MLFQELERPENALRIDQQLVIPRHKRSALKVRLQPSRPFEASAL